jgi:alpha-amylase/alpha-mannosidase (GH57 family)
MDHKKEKYLTVHGHFYQPPRENPWLEAIEHQDSAKPFHDWNERINYECYSPNSVSRIVDHQNRIIDIVNNYSLMSFNIGPTLLSWMEEHDANTYERIIKADCQSVQEHSGHGNAIAQNYNHIIMPLANEKDKYTQVIWGIKDFSSRFGRKPEGMWLAETAIDDETAQVLVDCGIKFTVLSPYQAEKVKPLEGNNDWQDVSWGNIDPARAYRYFLKSDPKKYLDIYFYDGAISKSVAFDHLLRDGEKFIKRLSDGVADGRDYDQLVNIATDGESYGHHTKFGDMALSYVLKIKTPQSNLKLTNYGEYLEKHPPTFEVDLKQKSSWSCFHGVERWASDCGCSTGGLPGWNQKWRKPLREGLNFLRDELTEIYEENASKYFIDVWNARNSYIEVVLDRNEDSINKFFEKVQKKKLLQEERISAIKLLEMQRQSMLMFTSCGWFFCDVSGIETTQILKYAARGIQIAEEFSEKDLETPFVEFLDKAKSNITELGTTKDIYYKDVKPATVNHKQVVSHWAISSLYEEYAEETEVYCYKINKLDYRRFKKGNSDLILGRIQIKSKVTLEQHDVIFALLHFGAEDFHCAIKEFESNAEYNKVKTSLALKYSSSTMTEVIREIDEHFGKEYYTLKDLFIKERRTIINELLQDKLEKFASTFQNLYAEGKMPILQLQEIGLEVPEEFRIVAEYTLSKSFNQTIIESLKVLNEDTVQKALDIQAEAEKLGAKLNKKPSKALFTEKITRNIHVLADNIEIHQAHKALNILTVAKQLKIDHCIKEAQNIYFNKVLSQIPFLLKHLWNSENLKQDKKFIGYLLNIGELLDINVEKFYSELNRVVPPANTIIKDL